MHTTPKSFTMSQLAPRFWVHTSTTHQLGPKRYVGCICIVREATLNYITNERSVDDELQDIHLVIEPVSFCIIATFHI